VPDVRLLGLLQFIIKNKIRAEGMVQVVEHLPSKYKAISSNPSTTTKAKLYNTATK
jgi:hypothetical protein